MLYYETPEVESKDGDFQTRTKSDTQKLYLHKRFLNFSIISLLSLRPSFLSTIALFIIIFYGDFVLLLIIIRSFSDS